MHLNRSTKRNRAYVVLSLAERFWPKVDKVDAPDACWLWNASMGSRGYGQIGRGGSNHIPMGAHVAAWEVASGEPVPEGSDIGHTCDVRRCVRNDEPGVYVVDGVEYPRWGHLFLTTTAGNNKDMAAKGRHFAQATPEKLARGERHWAARHPEIIPRGEQRPAAKLNDNLVRQIRQRYAAGETNKRALGREYGVSHSVIRGVVTGRTWTHVD